MSSTKLPYEDKNALHLTVNATAAPRRRITHTLMHDAGAGTDTAPMVLPSGNTIALYIDAPDSISTQDVGLTVAFTVFSSQAMYYKETNVQAAP